MSEGCECNSMGFYFNTNPVITHAYSVKTFIPRKLFKVFYLRTVLRSFNFLND